MSHTGVISGRAGLWFDKKKKKNACVKNDLTARRKKMIGGETGSILKNDLEKLRDSPVMK